MKRLLITLFLTIIPSTAFAQQIDDDALIITTLTSSDTVVISSALIFTEVKHYLTIERNMLLYKQNNNTAIQSAIRLGGGVAIHDMGKMMDLDASQTKRFGRRLRAHHKTLSQLNDSLFVKAIIEHAQQIKANT